MSHPGMPIKQVRITVGSLSLALCAQTVFWIVYDIIDGGVLGAWTAWTSGPSSGLSATTSLDLGLAALQLSAGCAALFYVRGAGGLLVTACAATVAFRAPVLWYLLLDSPAHPWFGNLEGPSLTAAGTTCLLAILVALVLTALLFRAHQLEQDTAAREEAENLTGGLRPVKVTATASSALLAALNVFYVCRNAVTAIKLGPDVLAHLLVGKGTGRAVLGVSSPWQWACLTVLCGVGMLLAAKRRPSATGFSVGLALFMMPPAFTKLWSYFAAGSPLRTPVDSGQALLELVGSAAVVALIVRDIRRDRQPFRLAAFTPASSTSTEVDSSTAESAELATTDA